MAERIGVLNLKVGACMTGPTKRLVADLEAAEAALSLSRNAMIRHWERWHEDNPNYVPVQRIDRAGKPKVTKDGKPVLEHPAYPQQLERDLYHVGRTISPHLTVAIVTAARNEVLADLKSKLPYNHAGKARFVWEAIKFSELPRPLYRPQGIIVPTNNAAFAYRDKVNRVLSKKNAEQMVAMSGGGCVLQFPLFSGVSGRAVTNPVVKLEVRQISEGNRNLLARIAHGTLSLKDSRLVRKTGKRGKTFWLFQLTYAPPTKDLGLDTERTAILYPMTGKSVAPFLIQEPDGYRWHVGGGKGLKGELDRLDNRRRELQLHYKSGVGQGHGKGRFFAKYKPLARSAMDARKRFIGDLLSEIVRFCRRNNCGTLLYREPGLQCRQKMTWFAEQRVEFPWTELAAAIEYKLSGLGIKLAVERISGKELRERFAPEEEEVEA